jgi:hypothetical protein
LPSAHFVHVFLPVVLVIQPAGQSVHPRSAAPLLDEHCVVVYLPWAQTEAHAVQAALPVSGW